MYIYNDIDICTEMHCSLWKSPDNTTCKTAGPEVLKSADPADPADPSLGGRLLLQHDGVSTQACAETLWRSKRQCCESSTAASRVDRGKTENHEKRRIETAKEGERNEIEMR